MSRRLRVWSREDAVSPVVGMILVLGISVVGIAAILYWGLPALDEMKANVEHRSAESQFQELDATIKELVAGTTEKTAKKWQPTLNRGSVVLVNNTERFVYAVEINNSAKDYNFLYWGFDNADANFSIYNAGPQFTVEKIEAFVVNGTTGGQTLRVNANPNSSAVMAPTLWGANQEMKLSLWTDDGAARMNITNSTIRFTIYEGGSIIARAFYVSTGRVDFSLEAGLSFKSVVQNNGAVLTGSSGTYAVLNAPPVPPAANTSGTTRHFARAVILNGTGSFAGDDRFDILVTLFTTSTLANYECTSEVGSSSMRSDCVERLKVFAYGTFAPAWEEYLSNSGKSYTYTKTTTTLQNGPSIPSISYLMDTEGWMGFTLLQSSVSITGS